MFWRVFKIKRKDAPALTWMDRLQATTRAWGLHISGWLQRKTMTFSQVRLKLYAVLFVLLFGSSNGWLVYHALERPHPSTPVGRLYPSHSILPTIRAPVDPSSLAGIEQFRSWLDSLKTDSAGRKIYESIRQRRPGLLDSLGIMQNSSSIHH